MIPLVDIIMLSMYDYKTGGYYIYDIYIYMIAAFTFLVAIIAVGIWSTHATNRYVCCWQGQKPWLFLTIFTRGNGIVASKQWLCDFVSFWTPSTIKLYCIVIPLAPVLLGDNNYHSSHWALDVIINWWFDNESSCQIVANGNDAHWGVFFAAGHPKDM